MGKVLAGLPLRYLTTAVRKAWISYECKLAAYPVRLQGITCGVLWGIGDVTAQQVEGAKGLDYRRLLLTAFFGGAMITPVGHYWYQGLDYLFLAKYRWPQASVRFVLSKVAADTVLFTPVYVAAFFAFMNSMDGGSLKDFEEKCSKDFWTTTAIEMVVWPPYQVINFARVPLRHQLVVMNGGTILDSAFLCWARSQDDWMPRLSPHTAD